MPRILYDLADRAGLDDGAGIHHRHPIGDLDRHADVVRHEDDPHARLALKLAQKQQNLHLHSRVERRRRLVGQQKRGLAGQRECNHRALPHAARKLVRIGLEPALGRRDAHPLQHIQRAGHRGFPRPAPMPDDRLGDLGAYGVDRIKRQRRVLEDHRGCRAPEIGELASFERQNVTPLEAHAPGDPRPALGKQLQERLERDALARPGFAEKHQHLASLKPQIDPVHRVDLRRAVEAHAEVLNLHQRRVHRPAP